MSRCNHVQIVFAPLPEEERDVEKSAAKEFALRAAERFRERSDGDASSNVEIFHLNDWKKDQLLTTAPILPEDEAKNTFVVFLISCGPDGSVHRSVRKTTKWIKEQEKKQQENGEKIQSSTTTTAVALLGHAVCKTSAEQMADEVYSSGRRLAKSLQSIAAPPQTPRSVPSPTTPSVLLETQIELEPPEEKFDGWLASWIDLL